VRATRFGADPGRTRHRTDDPGALGGRSPGRPTPFKGPVAFVLSETACGGTEQQAALLVRALVQAGVDVDVFVLAGPLADCDFGSASVVSLSRTRQGVAGLVGVLRASLRLAVLLRRRRYLVMHAAMARAHVLGPILAPRRTRAVAWRRNLGDHSESRWLMSWLEFCASKRSDLIIANSRAVAEYWIKRRNVGREGTRVIPNALEAWRFVPTQTKIGRTSEVRLLSVGNLRSVKGHAVLLEAVADLRRSGSDIRVTILGVGPLRESLKAQAKALGVPLELPGHVLDTRPYLAAADVYVHPSLSEGASNAIAEAMAQGSVIVSTTVGGAREMLGTLGILVAPADVKDLAKGIQAALKSPSRHRDMQARALKMFSIDAVVDAHIDAYQGR
jgi:glycosyltransferase involved in cell wall biosynthesis